MTMGKRIMALLLILALLIPGLSLAGQAEGTVPGAAAEQTNETMAPEATPAVEATEDESTTDEQLSITQEGTAPTPELSDEDAGAEPSPDAETDSSPAPTDESTQGSVVEEENTVPPAADDGADAEQTAGDDSSLTDEQVPSYTIHGNAEGFDLAALEEAILASTDCKHPSLSVVEDNAYDAYTYYNLGEKGHEACYYIYDRVLVCDVCHEELQRIEVNETVSHIEPHILLISEDGKGDELYCSYCDYKTALTYPCEHRSLIRDEDGNLHCTVCGAMVVLNPEQTYCPHSHYTIKDGPDVAYDYWNEQQHLKRSWINVYEPGEQYRLAICDDCGQTLVLLNGVITEVGTTDFYPYKENETAELEDHTFIDDVCVCGARESLIHPAVVPEIQSVELRTSVSASGTLVEINMTGNDALKGAIVRIMTPDGGTLLQYTEHSLSFEITTLSENIGPYFMDLTAIDENGARGNTVYKEIAFAEPEILSVELSATEIAPGTAITAKVTGDILLESVKLTITAPDGSVLEERTVAGLEFVIDAFGTDCQAGIYTLSFTAISFCGMVGNTLTKTVTVKAGEEEVPLPVVTVFTMEPSEIEVGMTVRFYIQAPGATQVRLYVDGKYYEGENDYATVYNGVATLDREFSQAGERYIQFKASADGEHWGELCEGQTLKVNEKEVAKAQINDVKVKADGQNISADVSIDETPAGYENGIKVDIYAYCNEQTNLIEAYVGESTENYTYTGEYEQRDGQRVFHLELTLGGNKKSYAGKYVVTVYAYAKYPDNAVTDNHASITINHVPQGKWQETRKNLKYDQYGHWYNITETQKCSVCGDVISSRSYDSEIEDHLWDTNEGGICTVCDYGRDPYKPLTPDDVKNRVESGMVGNEEWSGTGRFRGILQGLYSGKLFGDSTYCEDYWGFKILNEHPKGNGFCNRAAACMALSYMGYDLLPKDLKDSTDVESQKSELLTTHNIIVNRKSKEEHTMTMTNFNELYENYVNDHDKGDYSPVILYTKHKKNNGKGPETNHWLVIIGQDAQDKEYYSVLDSGTGNYAQIKLGTTNGDTLVITEYRYSGDGINWKPDEGYNADEQTLTMVQYSKGTAA